jgi:Fic family protein
MYVRHEAVLSSQIEGTQSSLQDLLAAQSELFEPAELPRDVNEVVNYVAAMNHGLARLSELPVSVRLIREIHERLLQGVRGARLTPADMPQALGDLETFLHGDDDLPLLIRIGLAHAQFETIHPFLDGNGRVGRLLITFLPTPRPRGWQWTQGTRGALSRTDRNGGRCEGADRCELRGSK